MAGCLDVNGQSDCPRSVVNLDQITDVPRNEDVRSLVESVRDVVAGILWSVLNARFFYFLDW